MQRRSAQLGPLETQLFAWAQLKERSLVRAGEIAQALGVKPASVTKLFSRLCRAQMALRLMKGLYLVPTKIPPGGRWGPNPYWVLAQYMGAIDSDYQVTGPAAFHRYGFTEQVANQVAVYNTRLSGRKKIGSVSYEFIKVSKDRLGATNVQTLKEGAEIPFSSPGRALLDAFYDWSRFGTIPKVFEWTRGRVHDKKLVRDLIASTISHGNVGCSRRIGYVLASSGVSHHALRPLREGLSETSSFLPLNPSKPKRGFIDKTWGLVVNE